MIRGQTEDSTETGSDVARACHTEPAQGALAAILGFFIDNHVVVVVGLALLVVAGLWAAPFRWDFGGLPRSPVAADALPEIGENQQIVFTEWPGRSPRDIDDQLTYPLTTALLGIAGVQTVRSFSLFGFSSIYVIFEDGVDFYWARSRVLEKLAALPRDTLPTGVSPTLGPDATALGQVFWYTLQGRDDEGTVVGGWDPHELRSIQDWTVRYALQSVPGVSEVASVGGFVKEYQVDIDPQAMRAHGVDVQQIARAVRQANLDVGARTLEINSVEYIIRGVGFLKDIRDLEQVVVRNVNHTPIRVGDVAKVGLGPAQRRGALDDAGAPAVGGVVIVRFGANPMEVIERVKEKIAEVAPSLPRRMLPDGSQSRVTIVPFYDRTQLIEETLGTLSTALLQQILLTAIVVLLLLRHLPSSLLISAVLPLGVLAAFVAMRATGVDANIMALGGIAIAIGTMVDTAIVMIENIVDRLDRSAEGSDRRKTIRAAATEVAPAIITSTLTTVVGFLPIFGLTAAEGRLFRPLALTKTFAMLGALALALCALPALAHLLLRKRTRPAEPSQTNRRARYHALLQCRSLVDCFLIPAGVVIYLRYSSGVGMLVIVIALARLAERVLPARWNRILTHLTHVIAVVALTVWLADDWLPLGVQRGFWPNRLFVALLVGSILLFFGAFIRLYPHLLRRCLAHRLLALTLPTLLVVLGTMIWLGFPALFGWLPANLMRWPSTSRLAQALPGLGREYLPPFDEGSFLFMPSTMPHASFGAALQQLQRMDAAIASIPEVDRIVGKIGRADSPLDPAPISMFETIVTYKSEYALDRQGRRQTFRFDRDVERFVRDAGGHLIPDANGRPFRQWRDEIRETDDIWREITQAAAQPGLTSAPRLMPIAARIVMLQSGMRAPLGLKVQGPDLETLERAALDLEQLLKQVPGIRPETVLADRIVGKPYLEIAIDREAIARHGMSIDSVQRVIQIAIGGRTVTRTVEGRERYGVRVRLMREDRDSVEALREVVVPSPLGHQIPLAQLARIRYVRGPQLIKSENTFLSAYVTFDKLSELAEVEVVKRAREFLRQRQRAGDLDLPAGVSYRFAGSYENQLRSDKRLLLLVPLALALIFVLVYLQFRRSSTTLMIFSAVAVALSGGFLLLWLYGQAWFLDLTLLGQPLRQLFHVHPINLSVAVWVGLIALAGIATDDGVVLATYLEQRFGAKPPRSVAEVRTYTVEASRRRIRPCLMTTATTLLALLPVITATGRGSDLMLPLAVPLLGGMVVEIITLFVVPLLYSLNEERKLGRSNRAA